MSAGVVITGAVTGAGDAAGDPSALPVTPVRSAQGPRHAGGRAVAALARQRASGLVAIIEAMRGGKQ
jgi:uncharacterized protein (DUF849 family)